VEEARRASGPEREALAAQVHQQLEALASGRGSREVADLLHQMLEGEQLTALRDAEGRSCRGAAVEALLAQGYPYALEVRPEDLEHLREGVQPQATSPWVTGAAFLVLAVGLVVQGLGGPPEPSSEPSSEAFGGPLVLQGLMLLSLVAATQGPGRSALGKLGLGGLAFLSFLGLILGLFGGYYGAVAGASGLLACLLLWLARR
jgi:hypothetical protein